MRIFLQAPEGEVRELKPGSHEGKGTDPGQEEEASAGHDLFGAALLILPEVPLSKEQSEEREEQRLDRMPRSSLPKDWFHRNR